jgi:hypothetical protein
MLNACRVERPEVTSSVYFAMGMAGKKIKNNLNESNFVRR